MFYSTLFYSTLLYSVFFYSTLLYFLLVLLFSLLLYSVLFYVILFYFLLFYSNLFCSILLQVFSRCFAPPLHTVPFAHLPDSLVDPDRTWKGPPLPPVVWWTSLVSDCLLASAQNQERGFPPRGQETSDECWRCLKTEAESVKNYG